MFRAKWRTLRAISLIFIVIFIFFFFGFVCKCISLIRRVLAHARVWGTTSESTSAPKQQVRQLDSDGA
jgi:hypothetical protein